MTKILRVFMKGRGSVAPLLFFTEIFYVKQLINKHLYGIKKIIKETSQD